MAAHAAMLSVAIFYAVNYFVAKRAVFTHVDPFALLAMRSIAGVLVFSFIAIGVLREKIDRKDWPRLIACGFFGIAINQTFFLWGLSKTVEVHAGVIMTLTPVFVLLIAWVLKQENLSPIKVLGLFIAFSGAVLLSMGGRQLAFDPMHLQGDLMIATNAASYAFYLVLLRPLSIKYHTLTLIGWVFLIGGCITIPLGTTELLAVSWGSLPTSVWLGMIYVIVFTTLLAYSFNAWALKRVPSSQVGIYIYVQPVLVTTIAAIGFQGSLNAEKVMYIMLVLVGVFAVSRKRAFGKKQKV